MTGRQMAAERSITASREAVELIYLRSGSTSEPRDSFRRAISLTSRNRNAAFSNREYVNFPAEIAKIHIFSFPVDPLPISAPCVLIIRERPSGSGWTFATN
jgi:hypothetical protein